MAFIEQELVQIDKRASSPAGVKNIDEISSPFFFAGADGFHGKEAAARELALDEILRGLAFRRVELRTVDMIQTDGFAFAVAKTGRKSSFKVSPSTTASTNAL